MNENISWGKIAVLVVAIAGVGVLGFVVGRSFWFQGDFNITSDKSRVGVVAEKQDEIERKSWKYYRNDKYGYEIEYPSDAILLAQENPTSENEYPQSTAVNVLHQSAINITISVGPAFVTICVDCGPGGVGIGDEPLEESVKIDGGQYVAKGFVNADVGSKYMSVPMPENASLMIQYGYESEFGKPITAEQITKANDIVNEIISSIVVLNSGMKTSLDTKKTFSGHGVTAYFEDGIEFQDSFQVVFSPKGKLISNDDGFGPGDTYSLIFPAKRTVVEIMTDVNSRSVVTKKPVQKNINGWEVVEWAEGGTCESRTAEVIGMASNYEFSSLGCGHTQEEDFASFEKVIASMKSIK